VDESDIDGAATVARATVAGLAAALAVADPGTGILAMAALPVLDVSIEHVRRWKRAACGYAVTVAAEAAGVAPAELVALLTAEPAKIRLLASALEAASETAWQAKMRVLGKALASGALASDDAKVMEEVGWTRITRELEAPHLRILVHLCKEDPEYPGEGHWIAAHRRELRALSGFDQLIGPALSMLERDSLIRATDGSDFDLHFRSRWGITSGSDRTVYVRGELAEACIERFKAAGFETN